LYRFRFFLLVTLFLCICGAQIAAAQTISAYQGNGQLICNFCNTAQNIPGISAAFAPLFAKVTDAAGNPVVGATVFWNTDPIGGGFVLAPASNTSITDNNGLAHITYVAPLTQASQNGPAQTIVTASLASNPGATATFTLTQTSLNVLGSAQVNLDLYQNPAGSAPQPGTTLTGTAGTAGASFVVGVFGSGTAITGGNAGLQQPLQNVGIRLVNLQTNVTATCAQSPGADPGSVLTGADGYATCTPVFSGSGKGQFVILIGGTVNTTATTPDGTTIPATPPYVSSPNEDQYSFLGYTFTRPVNLDIAPVAVSSVQLVSGNSQTGNQGQSLAAPLVVVVRDASNNPLSGQTVNWSVSPATAASLSPTISTTDVNGQARTSVILASNASGTVTVTATSAGKAASFTITAVIPVTVSGIQKLSGDTQSATANSVFANPLVVQVTTSNGQAAVGQTVQFAVNGPATLSALSATTDANGRAQVTARAGNGTGAATVTASVGSFSTTFSLTVVPPGPQLTAVSFLNGADFQPGSISPCSIATIVAPGLAPGVQGVVSSNLLGIPYLNYTVANDTVFVGGTQAPIYYVANQNNQQSLTFQVPCSVTPGASVPVTVNVSGGTATLNVVVKPASPGVFVSQTLVPVQNFGNLPLAIVVKPDGSIVTPQNPARKGETVIAYTTGLGASSPAVATNALAIRGTASNAIGKIIVGVNNSGVPLTYARVSEDLIGVSLVAFQIPTDAAAGNVVFSIGVQPVGDNNVYYSNAEAIYIQ